MKVPLFAPLATPAAFFRNCLVLLAFIFAVTPTRALEEFYSNPHGPEPFPTWASTQGSDYTARTFDSFQVTSNARITQIIWTGCYIDQDAAPGATAPPEPLTTSWRLGFYADNAGTPGALVHSVDIPVSSVSSVLISQETWTDGNPIVRRQYTANLPESAILHQGTTYWFSPFSIQPVFQPHFSWMRGFDDMGDCVQRITPPTDEVIRPFNRAFTLRGEFPAPGISLKVGAATIASGGSYNFGAEVVPGQERSVTVTITNTGDAPLTGIAASISPTGSQDFRVGSPPPPSTIAAGASGTFSVIFSPQAAGNRTGSLRVTSNAKPNPYIIQLSGTGTDTVPPTITNQADDLTIVCDAAGNSASINNWLQNNGGAMATDNASTVTWSHNFTALPSNCGSTTVVFTASDASGNTATTSAQVIQLDQTPPAIISQAAGLSIICDAADRMATVNAWLAARGNATATDNSGASVVWTHNFTALPGGCAAVTVTFTASDASGNLSTTAAQLTSADNTAPTITTPPSGVTVESDGQGNTAALNFWLGNQGGASASDTCTAVTWSHNFTGLSNTLPQTVPVTFSANDACGNSTTTSASFIIQDTTPPQITTAAKDFYGDCGEGENQIGAFLANRGGAQAVDAAGPVTWTHNYNGTLPACKGNISVTFTATDAVGLNVSTSARFFLFPPGAIWIGPATGSWTDAPKWDDGTVPSQTTDAYVDLFDFQDTTVNLAGSGRSVRDLHIAAGDSVNIPSGAILEPYRAIYNDGMIRLGGGSESTDGIRLQGSVSLEGTGKLILQGSNSNNIYNALHTSAHLLTIGAGQEIVATAGTVAGNSRFYLPATNHGTITADQGGLEIFSRPMTNAGLIRAINGGTLRLSSLDVSNAEGRLTSASGGHLQITSATSISGGILSGDGNITSSQGTTLGGGMLVSGESQITFSGAVNLSTQVTNDGAIVIGDTGADSAGMRLLNDALLDGSGQVTIRPGASRGIYAANNNSAHTLTVGPDQEITSLAGEGADEAYMYVTAVNQGTISANEGAFRIRTRNMTNEGLIRASNGGTLTLDDMTLENASGQLLVGDGGRFMFTSGAIVDGGTVAGTGSVAWESGSVLRGGVHLSSDIVTTVKGVGNTSTQVTNDGTIFIGDQGTLTSGIRLLDSTLLDGSGQVVIRPGGTCGIYAASNNPGRVLTVGTGQEIITAPGTVAGDAYLYTTTINNGRLTADRGGLEIQGRQFMNNGAVTALSGGTVAFTSAASFLTNYNSATDTLSGGLWEALSDGLPATLNLQNAPIAAIASNTVVRLSGAAASIPQLANLANVSGTLSLENGKSLSTSADMAISGVLQYGLPAALETTRLAITGNVNFTGARVDVLDQGMMTSGSYLIASWTGTATGEPSLGSVPPWSRHRLVLDPLARTLRLEVVVTAMASITGFSVAPGIGPHAGQNVVTLSAIAAPGTSHTVEASSDLGFWSVIAYVTSDSSGTVTWTINEPTTVTRRFYRLGAP